MNVKKHWDAPAEKVVEKASSEIRFIGDMQRLQVRPGDVFVLQVDEEIADTTAEYLRAALRSALGDDAKVLVLTKGLTLGVMGE